MKLSITRAGIVVIDARSPEAYELEHIPTAINILTQNDE